DELRQGVQCRFASAPVVLRRPMAREFLNHRERHALRLIRDGLLLGPVRGRDASAEVGQVLVWHVDLERADGGIGRSHAALLLDSSPPSSGQGEARIAVPAGPAPLGQRDGNEFHRYIAPGEIPRRVIGLWLSQAVLAANGATAIAQVDVKTGQSGQGAQAAAKTRSPEPD